MSIDDRLEEAWERGERHSVPAADALVAWDTADEPGEMARIDVGSFDFWMMPG